MKKTFVTLFLLALAVFIGPPAAPGDQAGPKAIAFDDFIQIKRMTDLQLSPDGNGSLAWSRSWTRPGTAATATSGSCPRRAGSRAG
jgi:hypothetical protein